MSPLDFDGPTFLLFFVGCMAGSLAFAVVYVLVQRTTRGTLSDEELDAIDGAEIAWLRGGPRLAIAAALAALCRRGLVCIAGPKVAAADSEGAADDRGIGGYRTSTQPHPTSPLEGAALTAIARLRGRATLEDLERERGCREAIAAIDRRASERGLAIDRKRRFRRNAIVIAPIAVTMLIGLAKLVVGGARDRPITLLVFLLLGSFLLVVKLASLVGVRTERGDVAIAELRDRKEALRCTAASAPQQLSPLEVALAAGLYGVEVLGGELESLASVLAPAASRTGCGGGDGGSSDGGSGGGGCGGCGSST